MPRVTVSRKLYLCKVVSTVSGFDITHYPVVAVDDSNGPNAGLPYVMRDINNQMIGIGASTIEEPPNAPVPVNLFYDGERDIYVYNGEEYNFDALQRLRGSAQPYGG